MDKNNPSRQPTGDAAARSAPPATPASPRRSRIGSDLLNAAARVLNHHAATHLRSAKT